MAFCLVGHYDGAGSGGRCVRCPSCRRGASDDAASVAFDHSTEVNMDAGTRVDEDQLADLGTRRRCRRSCLVYSWTKAAGDGVHKCEEWIKGA